MREAETFGRELGDRRRLGSVLADMGARLRNVGDHERALEASRQALDIATELGDRGLEIEARYRLAQDEVGRMAAEFDRRRHLIVEGLNALPGVSCVKPKGAFYAFANVSGLFGRKTQRESGPPAALSGSTDVAAFLLDQARVAVVPGVDFGSDAHVRLSYATSTELIQEGLARMAAAIHTLQ